MRAPNDRPAPEQATDRRVTVQEAAILLGLSEDAVRSRLKRGTLRKEKGTDGTVFVVLGGRETGDRPTANGDRSTTGQPTDQSALALMQGHLDSLSEQLAYLREQLDHEREANRENRRIIAGLVQRVPELGPAYEPRGVPETAAEDAEGHEERPFAEEAQEGSEPRSWWRRVFGG